MPRHGIDRVNPRKGYEVGNSVTCCWTCNKFKWIYDAEDLVRHAGKIAGVYPFEVVPDTHHKRHTLRKWSAYGDSRFKSLYNAQYKRFSKKDERNFCLNFQQFKSIITQPCAYCGAPPAEDRTRYGSFNGRLPHHGVDRRDNLKDYTLENSVSCCRWCNVAKCDMRESDFVSHAQKIFNYYGAVRDEQVRAQ